MDDEQLTVDDHPDDQALQFIREQLAAYTLAIAGADDAQPVAFVLRDAHGALVGGLSGWTWGGGLEGSLLRVHEDWRGQGHGARLLRAAERAAISQGYRQAVLDTYSFQAPGFYQRLGYEVAGVFENVPAGHQKYFLRKELR
jgi:ribosomal protein S18 acetylase RimI-like enzyme